MKKEAAADSCLSVTINDVHKYTIFSWKMQEKSKIVLKIVQMDGFRKKIGMGL